MTVSLGAVLAHQWGRHSKLADLELLLVDTTREKVGDGTVEVLLARDGAIIAECWRGHSYRLTNHLADDEPDSRTRRLAPGDVVILIPGSHRFGLLEGPLYAALVDWAVD